MDEDLGVPQALAVLHETVRAGNAALDAGDLAAAADASDAVRSMAGVLGIDPTDPSWGVEAGPESAALGRLVEALIEQRAAARAGKDWAAADAVRDALSAAGILLEDAPTGTSWTVSR